MPLDAPDTDFFAIPAKFKQGGKPHDAEGRKITLAIQEIRYGKSRHTGCGDMETSCSPLI
jgi:hypothetical protein